MAATVAPLGAPLFSPGLSEQSLMSLGATERPLAWSRQSSSSSGLNDGWATKKRSSTNSGSPASDADRMSSLVSVRSSQFSDSTYDPSDSRIVHASMGNLRGQSSTPAVVFAFPGSASVPTLPPPVPARRSSLAPVANGVVASTAASPIKPTDRRTSLPPSPYVRPSTAQPVASTSSTPTGSPMKRLPRSSSSRRSISSLLGSIFNGPVPGLSAPSPPPTPKQPGGFSSDSWQHAVAVQVIEAGKGRPSPADEAPMQLQSESEKPLPIPEEGVETTQPERESYHDPAAAYFDTTDGEGAGSRHSRKPSQTSEWSLDVDLGGQGLGIAYLFEGDDLTTEYANGQATAAVAPPQSVFESNHERGRTHSSTLSTSTAFSSLPPRTPRMRSSSPKFGRNALPRPGGRFFSPDSKELDDMLPPHLPDLPPCSPLLAGVLPLLPVTTPPDDALLDLSPRRRSLRPPGIARPKPVEDEDDDQELILFDEAALAKDAGTFKFPSPAFSSPASDGGHGFQARMTRGRTPSIGTFGQRRSIIGNEEVDLDSETEEDDEAAWASEAETRSSVYSQRSATLPLSIPSKTSPPRPSSIDTATVDTPGSTTPTQPCSPVRSLRRAMNIDRSNTHSRSSSSTSVASMGSGGDREGRASPSRPMKNPARLAMELQKEGAEGLW